MRAMPTTVALLAGVLVASRAAAQHMGSGSGKSAVTAPATKSSGTAAERAELPADKPPIEPRHAILAAPGTAPSYGESAEAGASGEEAHETWRSGDLVRSWTSADVRASRRQQAPDLEWTTARAAAPKGPPQRSRQEERQERRGAKR